MYFSPYSNKQQTYHMKMSIYMFIDTGDTFQYTCTYAKQHQNTIYCRIDIIYILLSLEDSAKAKYT